MCAFKPANPLIRETAPEGHPLDVLEGAIERITFHNEDNGYTVARLLPEGARDVITILGNFSNPVVGESLICHGTWSHHAQWGRQMQVARYEVVRPATAFAIEKYLGSGMVKGVGPVMAKRIVEKFGVESLDVIEEDPAKLQEVQGIGKKRIEKIKQAWNDQREIRNIMLFLQSHGVSPAYAVKFTRPTRTKASRSSRRTPTNSPPTSGASGSRRRTRSPARWVSPRTTRAALKQASCTCSTRPSRRAAMRS